MLCLHHSSSLLYAWVTWVYHFYNLLACFSEMNSIRVTNGQYLTTCQHNKRNSHVPHHSVTTFLPLFFYFCWPADLDGLKIHVPNLFPSPILNLVELNLNLTHLLFASPLPTPSSRLQTRTTRRSCECVPNVRCRNGWSTAAISASVLHPLQSLPMRNPPSYPRASHQRKTNFPILTTRSSNSAMERCIPMPLLRNKVSDQWSELAFSGNFKIKSIIPPTSWAQIQAPPEMRTLRIYDPCHQVPRMQWKAVLSFLWWHVPQAPEETESCAKGGRLL